MDGFGIDREGDYAEVVLGFDMLWSSFNLSKISFEDLLVVVWT